MHTGSKPPRPTTLCRDTQKGLSGGRSAELETHKALLALTGAAFVEIRGTEDTVRLLTLCFGALLSLGRWRRALHLVSVGCPEQQCGTTVQQWGCVALASPRCGMHWKGRGELWLPCRSSLCEQLPGLARPCHGLRFLTSNLEYFLIHAVQV